MLALLEDEADACSGCGHPLSESADPGAENTYTAPLPTRCHACTAIAIRAEDYTKAQHRNALLLHAERKPGLGR